MSADEWGDGTTDLNGDGDAFDNVAALSWRVGGENIGIAASGEAVPYDGGFLFAASELDHGGADLNGDGDATDLVFHAEDFTAGSSNLGVAAYSAEGTASSGSLTLFMASEDAQGQTDLNGDGDAIDSVYHLFDPATGVVNLGIAADGFVERDKQAVGLTGGFAFLVGEDWQGSSDLNGDGDALDSVLHVYSAASGVSNVGVALDVYWGGEMLVPFGAGVVARASEASHGMTDLNGDGDHQDNVLHHYDPASGMVALPWAAGGLVAGPTTVAVFVPESQQGSIDLNADGDAADHVLHIYDPATGMTNLAIDGLHGVAMGSGFAFGVAEYRQGNTDLNGDGDAQDDAVVHVYQPGSGITNVGLNSAGLLVEGDLLFFTVPEWDQGLGANLDLNGDGDTNDRVAHVHSSTGTVNLALAMRDSGPPGMIGFAGQVAFVVSEQRQGFSDINGNGEGTENVLFVYRHGVGAEYVGLTVSHDQRLAASEWLLAVPALEWDLEDLNGDGDKSDAVLQLLTHDIYPVAEDDVFAVPRQGLWAEPPPGVLLNDFDVDGDSLETVWFRAPERGTFTLYTNGAFDYEPDGSGSYEDSFWYWATDGVWLTNPARASLVVNDPPTAADDGPYLVDAGGTISEQPPGLLDNDADIDGDPLEVSLFSEPSHGTLAVDIFGSFRYEHDGSPGIADSFTYVVEDNYWLSNVATVAITVNQPPTAVSDGPLVVDAGATLSGSSVLGNDNDPNGDALTAVLVTPPSHGVLTLQPDGSFTYGHDGSASTTDAFGYRAFDGRLTSDETTVTISITQVLPTTLAPTSVGLVDPTQGKWYVSDYDTEAVTSFFYGNPGDIPFVGDWDCDGAETPGLFRQSDAYAYLRNSNTVGIADIRFYFGNPADVPLAGDFDGDGCDSLSIYRPSEQRFYIMNELGENEGGLGAAEFSFTFGNPGDKPVVGDWDGDGIDEIGLHRESSGFFYYRNTLDVGIADGQFYFGDPGDRFVAGDWGTIDGVETPAVFRPGNTTFYFRWTNTPGAADSEFVWGESAWLPVSGVLD